MKPWEKIAPDKADKSEEAKGETTPDDTPMPGWEPWEVRAKLRRWGEELKRTVV